MQPKRRWLERRVEKLATPSRCCREYKPFVGHGRHDDETVLRRLIMCGAIDGPRIALLSTWTRARFLRALPLRILFRLPSLVLESTVTTAPLDHLRRRCRLGLSWECDGGRSVRMMPAAAQHGMKGNHRGDGDRNYCAHKIPERFRCCPQLSADLTYGLTVFD